MSCDSYSTACLNMYGITVNKKLNHFILFGAKLLDVYGRYTIQHIVSYYFLYIIICSSSLFQGEEMHASLNYYYHDLLNILVVVAMLFQKVL